MTPDVRPWLNIHSRQFNKAEGTGKSTAFVFKLNLDTAASTEQSVQWQVSNGGSGLTRAGASDFVGGAFPSGAVTFAPGETSKLFTINVAAETTRELNELFWVELSDPSSGLVFTDSADATSRIYNDDNRAGLPAARGTGRDDILHWVPGQHAYGGLGGREALHMGEHGYRHSVVRTEADGSVVLVNSDPFGQWSLLRGIDELVFADGRLVMDADDPAARVSRLYEAALDRLPDQAGLNFWIDAVQDGQPLAALASGFLRSEEFRARFGGDAAGNGAFVDRLYQNVLGRSGEAGGRKFWVDPLDGGASRADVLVAFSDGGENRAGTASPLHYGIWDRSEEAAQVARLYDTVFGRLPDAPGLVAWKTALEGGRATLAQVADAFTRSQEFRDTYGGLDNRGFADALYRNTLDRPADRDGLNFWAGQLDAGAARSAVVLAFSESPEHAVLTANTIGGENAGRFGMDFA